MGQDKFGAFMLLGNGAKQPPIGLRPQVKPVAHNVDFGEGVEFIHHRQRITGFEIGLIHQLSNKAAF